MDQQDIIHQQHTFRAEDCRGISIRKQRVVHLHNTFYELILIGALKPGKIPCSPRGFLSHERETRGVQGIFSGATPTTEAFHRAGFMVQVIARPHKRGGGGDNLARHASPLHRLRTTHGGQSERSPPVGPASGQASAGPASGWVERSLGSLQKRLAEWVLAPWCGVEGSHFGVEGIPVICRRRMVRSK